MQLSRKLLSLQPYCSSSEVHKISCKTGSGINILYLLTGPIHRPYLCVFVCVCVCFVSRDLHICASDDKHRRTHTRSTVRVHICLLLSLLRFFTVRRPYAGLLRSLTDTKQALCLIDGVGGALSRNSASR